MLGRPFGNILLAAVLLAAGLAGIAGFWVAWPRTANTSPLAALFALAWSCTYLAAGKMARDELTEWIEKHLQPAR